MELRDGEDFGCEELTAEPANDAKRPGERNDVRNDQGWKDQSEVDTEMISPLAIDREQWDTIARSVPGGAENIQDAYPLTPLQEGILFHHLANQETGTYVLSQLIEVQSRSRLDTLVQALQAVIDRHDALRIAVLSDGLPRPVQVVYRTAALAVTEFKIERGEDVAALLASQLSQQQRGWDLQHAPAVRLYVVADPSSQAWYALLHVHHVICDYGSLRGLVAEVVAHMRQVESLPRPVAYRLHVEQALANARLQEGEEFFRSKLGDVSEPTNPFGITCDVRATVRIEEARRVLDAGISTRLRSTARRIGMSSARIFHAAFALVIANTSAREDIVFGTVMLASWQRRARSLRILGLSVNTLPLHLVLTDTTARGLVEKTDRELTALLDYEQVPLVLAQRCTSLPALMPSFGALLNFRHVPYQPEAEWEGVAGVRLLAAPEAQTNYPLALIVDDLRDAFVLNAQTDARMEPHRVITYMETALESLVRALEDAPETPALALKILPEAERRLIVEQFNAAQKVDAPERLIHELFERQAERTPNAVAVTDEGRSVTYAELNRQANQLARYLKGKGLGADALVAICVERGLEMVVGLLGILKAGGAYVPLDPSYPRERLAYVLNDSVAKILLTQRSLAGRFAGEGARLIVLEDVWQQVSQEEPGNLDARASGLRPEHLAYVIYTSGSTGLPKGVMIEHQNVTRLFSSTQQWFDFNERDVWTLFHSFAFDFSVWELWGALLYGGRVVVVPYHTARSPSEFYRLLCEQGVTVLNQTPSAFVQLIDAQAQSNRECHSLRVVIFGGEALDLHKLRPWVERNSCSRPRLVNMYGITETTVHVTYRQLTEQDIASGQGSPIGIPIPDLQLYLLDARQQIVPIGVVGEIYVGGAGVARAYLNRPDLNAQRFIADTFRGGSQRRLYRSGDLGRWRADGTLEYLGRNDQQVKIRGFRIELGEIEAQLALHEQVKEVAVVAREDVAAHRTLIAYFVPKDASAVPCAEELRRFLSASLPDHMVPSAFMVLVRLPLTSNGKLDRRALPRPGREAYASRQYEEPLGATEQALAEIWHSLLKVELVGRHDSFFDLGGHSLLVLKLAYEVRQRFGTVLKVTDVYKNPALEELSRCIDGGAVRDDLVNLTQEATLKEGILAISGPRAAPPKSVLLTGATGFVGRFLLAHLLQTTDATIYCLVRAASRQQAASRLEETLTRWDLWKEKCEKRLTAIPCDLRSPQLGLDAISYSTLVNEVDSIYHCATSMNHLETYAMARPTIVAAVTDLLRISTQGRPKQVNYLSTMSVFSIDGTGTLRIVDEKTPIDGERHARSQGYAASKWVGEKIVMLANERGIPCNVFRIGLVWADAKQGRYDELQREYRVMKSCLLAGYGIADYRFMSPPTPVDYVAQSVASLADRHESGGRVFHISAARQGIEGLFECCNQLLQIPLELKPLSEWIRWVKGQHEEGRSLPIMPLLEAVFAMDEKSFEISAGMGAGITKFDCSRTHLELERAGIMTPEVGEDLLQLCLEDMLWRDKELQHAAGLRGRYAEFNRPRVL